MRLRKSYTTPLGRYYRGLETEDFVYYVNYQEGDENACVHMYRKKNMELVSNNYFAYNDMFEVLTDNKFTRISPYMKENLKLHKEAEENEKKRQEELGSVK
jgi:hypothetical protein